MSAWVISSGIRLGDLELDRRHCLQVVTEPSLDGGLAGHNVLGPAVVLHHRNIMAGHDDVACLATPVGPNCRNGCGSAGGIIGHVGAPGEQFGPVLGGIAAPSGLLETASGATPARAASCCRTATSLAL